MAVYAANLTTTDDRLRNLDHLAQIRHADPQGLGQFVLGGEAVAPMLTSSRISTLPSRKHDEEVQLCAFDVLAVGEGSPQASPLDAQDEPQTTAGAAS